MILAAFYWYQLRPMSIYKECHKSAISSAIKIGKEREDVKEGWYLRDDYESEYQECLRSKGLRGD